MGAPPGSKFKMSWGQFETTLFIMSADVRAQRGAKEVKAKGGQGAHATATFDCRFADVRSRKGAAAHAGGTAPGAPPAPRANVVVDGHLPTQAVVEQGMCASGVC